MAPFPRQQRRRVTVEELLLRMTGDAVPNDPVRHRLHPGYRARLAGGREKRTTHNVLRLSTGTAAVVATVCLTAFAAASKPYSPEPVAPPPLSVQPEIPPPPATTSAGSAPTPSPASTSAPNPVTFSAQPTATPAPEPHPAQAASCAVRFTITDSWPGGFTASVGITNTGSSALSPWTLTWTFTADQQVTHGWDGEYSQSGSRVTVHPASYNPAIAASATTNIGFNGSFAAANPAPTGFTVNGTRCAHAD